VQAGEQVIATEAALLEVHVNVVAPPDGTLVGFAVSVTVVGFPTVTVTCGEYAWPPAVPLAVTWKVVVAASAPVV
jgi:hypothetical protein